MIRSRQLNTKLCQFHANFSPPRPTVTKKTIHFPEKVLIEVENPVSQVANTVEVLFLLCMFLRRGNYNVELLQQQKLSQVAKFNSNSGLVHWQAVQFPISLYNQRSWSPIHQTF